MIPNPPGGRTFLRGQLAYVGLLGWLAVAAPLGAQRSLSLSFSDQFGAPVGGASVELLVSAQRLVYARTTTDTAGLARFPELYYGDTVFLRLADYRFLETVFPLPPGRDSARFVAERLPLELTQITVNARKSPVRISGDTMYFDVDAYRLGNETTLGDLVNRVPELSLSDAGEIVYRGKPVDHLFVEGRDIFGGRQGSATDGISAEDVAGIRLIQQYRGFGDLLGGASDAVAVDVQLSDSARARWLGTTEAAAGTRRTHRAAANLSRVGERGGLNLVLTASGEPGSRLTTRDYLNARTAASGADALRKPGRENFTLADLVPAPLRLPAGLRHSRGVHGQAGHDRRLRPNLGLRTHVLLNVERHAFGRSQLLSSAADSTGGGRTFYRTRDAEDYGRRVALGFAELTLGSLADSSRSRGGLGLEFSHLGGQSRVDRALPEAGPATDRLTHDFSTSTGRFNAYRIAPQRRRTAPGKRTEISWEYERELTAVTAAAAELLPDFLGFRRSATFVTQTNILDVSHQMTYQGGRFSGELTLGSRAEFLTAHRRHDGARSATGPPARGRDLLLPLEAIGSYTVGHYRARLILRGAPLRRTVGGATATQLPARALLVLRRGLTVGNYVQLRYGTGTEPGAGLRQSAGLPASPRPFTVERNDADAFGRTRVRTAGADYFNRRLGGGKGFVLLTASRSWVNDAQQRLFFAREAGWIETTYRPLDQTINSQLTLRGRVPVAGGVYLSPGIVLTEVHQPANPLNERPYRLGQRRLSATVGVPRWGRWEMLLTYTANRTRQRLSLTAEAPTDVRFSTREWAATLKYRAERLTLTAEASRVRARIRGLSAAPRTLNYPASLDLGYRPRKKDFPELYFRGNNLINFRPRRQQRAALDDLGSATTDFDTLPGYLQMGLRRRW